MVPPRLVLLCQPIWAVCIKLNYLSKFVMQTSTLSGSCSYVPWKKSNGTMLSIIKDENRALIAVSIRASGSGLTGVW